MSNFVIKIIVSLLELFLEKKLSILFIALLKKSNTISFIKKIAIPAIANVNKKWNKKILAKSTFFNCLKDNINMDLISLFVKIDKLFT